MATTGFSAEMWNEFISMQDRRRHRHADFEGEDPFDKATEHDDDETDDYALYRLGVK